ncbi:glycosyltransferase family 2 protein [Sulfurimonas sp. HSL-1656]|uniref:glycosyltransferase family 2 protein n=1 Tax=Thiomicrolovo subterrani TaxID=3131934 RepID=UPI0031F80F0C
MIYIVTPVFNRKKFTRNYLEALSIQTCKDFKVVIVDDGSTDGTKEMILKNFPEVHYIEGDGNLWWAEGTNVGVKYALEQGATYIMTLNDDTIPESDYMEKMMYWSQNKPDALLGALAIDQKTGDVVYGGEKRNWRTGRGIPIIDSLSPAQQKGLHEVDLFPGRGLLIPAQVFDEIGFYDSKHFPQTIADLDFTYRAKRAGFGIFCNYDAKIAIYPEESGGVAFRKNKSWKNYFQHLFGIRGGGNLKWFVVCALKNCPIKYRFQFIFIGVIRRIFGYWIK